MFKIFNAAARIGESAYHIDDRAEDRAEEDAEDHAEKDAEDCAEEHAEETSLDVPNAATSLVSSDAPCTYDDDTVVSLVANYRTTPLRFEYQGAGRRQLESIQALHPEELMRPLFTVTKRASSVVRDLFADFNKFVAGPNKRPRETVHYWLRETHFSNVHLDVDSLTHEERATRLDEDIESFFSWMLIPIYRQHRNEHPRVPVLKSDLDRLGLNTEEKRFVIEHLYEGDTYHTAMVACSLYTSWAKARGKNVDGVTPETPGDQARLWRDKALFKKPSHVARLFLADAHEVATWQKEPWNFSPGNDKQHALWQTINDAFCYVTQGQSLELASQNVLVYSSYTRLHHDGNGLRQAAFDNLLGSLIEVSKELYAVDTNVARRTVLKAAAVFASTALLATRLCIAPYDRLPLLQVPNF